jgi:hypothetical protein
MTKTLEILKVLAGSRAYGLEEDDSDFDYRGVFVVPTSQLLSVGLPKIKETQWIEGGEDDVSWELRHFCELALHCNPNVMEVFVAPPAIITDKPIWEGEELRGLFSAFVSRKRVYDAYRGYAKNQRVKMFEPTGGVRAGERSWKFASNYLRVLRQGAELLQDPEHWSVFVKNGDWKNFLLDVKHGEISKGVIIDEATILENILTESYLNSNMQEEAQLDKINEFIISVRYNRWVEDWIKE